MCVRLLCSLFILVVCTVVHQVALFSSYNSEATASLLCSLPILIYSNFSQFIWIFTEFIWIYMKFFNFSRECVKKATWSVLSQLPSSHIGLASSLVSSLVCMWEGHGSNACLANALQVLVSILSLFNQKCK